MGRNAIKSVRARQVFDCRGDPTVEVDVLTEGGSLGRADVPSGRSTGQYEAYELRDGDREHFFGRGVSKAIRNVNERIGPVLKGREATQQRENDALMVELDGTEGKSNLGANAIVGASLALARAGASALGGLPLYSYLGGEEAHVLPVPTLDMIEGGKIAASDLDFQEHQLVPVGAATFSEALRMASEVYHHLGENLARIWGRHSLNVGVEGGYCPPGMKDPREAFDAELKAAQELGYGDKFVLSLDAAASHLYDPQTDRYSLMGRKLSRGELIDYYADLVSSYPVKSIEDPLQQNDFEGFVEVTKSLKIQIIGDDFFVTNPKRIRRGIELRAANALLLKVNQIGTVSEARDAAELASKNRYAVQVSERSGQTEDTWLADFAVAINAGQIKTGCPCRGERTAQYNQLLRIEEELGSRAVYPGRKAYPLLGR